MGDKENKKDVRVSKDWILSVLEKDIDKPKEITYKEIDEMGPAKPGSRLQGYIQDIFEGLNELSSMKRVNVVDDGRGNTEIVDLPSEDFFDKWYENSGIAAYTQAYKLMTQLNSIASSVGVSTQADYGEDAFQELLRDLAAKCVEEPETVYAVGEAINTQYPGLAALPMKGTAEGFNEAEQELYNQELSKVRKSVESNIDQFEDLIAEMDSAAKTDFEEIASNLNQVVIFGESLWELALYAVISPRAPRLIINGLDYRANLHMLLEGDISTAKSKILEICKMVAPKMVVVDDTTKASLEGVAPMGKGGEIADGVIDIANNGDIIIEEFTNSWAKMPLFRRIMDCKRIQIFKKGIPKIMDVNTTVIAACNPEADFFQEDSYFRTQLSFKEGILSRFDIQVPLTATTSNNKLLVDRLNLFGEAEVDIDLPDIKRKLELIASGMETLHRVKISPVHLEMVRDAFNEKNDYDHRVRVLKNRPLVLLRDLETLSRLVNVVAAVNFTSRRVEDGVLHAEEEDVEKAIGLWENLIQMRIALYAKQSRQILTVADEIVKFILLAQPHNDDGEVLTSDVYQDIVSARRIVSHATFYREIKKLRNSGRIVQFGLKKSRLKVVIE